MRFRDYGPEKAIHGTVAYRIFKDGFPVWTQQMFAIREDDAERYGVRATGDRAVDSAMLSRTVRVTLPISDMIAIRQQGGEVMPIEHDHREMIIDLIRDHMKNWERVVYTMDVRRTIPLDDLREMDTFALELLEIVNKERTILDKEAFDRRQKEYVDVVEARSKVGFARPRAPYASINDGAIKTNYDIPDGEATLEAALGYDPDKPTSEPEEVEHWRGREATYSDAFSTIEDVLSEMSGGSL